MGRFPSWWERISLSKGARDLGLFVVGIGGVIHETVTPDDARPLLLGAFVAMLGLPFALAADRARNGDDDDVEE